MFSTLKTVATELNVSERFLRQLVREKRIPVYKLSPRTTRFDLNELRDYMRLIAEGEAREHKLAND